MADKAFAETNIQDFLKKHGNKGFIQLFLSNYLFELAMYYLHSEKPKAHQVLDDTGYRFYIDGKERVYTPKELEKFKRDLRSECGKKAAAIIEKMEKTEDLEKITVSSAGSGRISQMLQEAFESIVQEGE